MPVKRSRRAQGTPARRRNQGGAGAGRSKVNRVEEARRFWGDPSAVEGPPPKVRPTPDPSALVRSLGPPPLVGQDRVADAYFTAVYDRAVGLASALAAANGLLEDEGGEEADGETG